MYFTSFIIVKWTGCGDCSSTVERQIVDLEVAGAAPVSHPRLARKTMRERGRLFCRVVGYPGWLNKGIQYFDSRGNEFGRVAQKLKSICGNNGHLNLVRVEEVNQLGESRWGVVQEWIEGPNLREYLEEGSWDKVDARDRLMVMGGLVDGVRTLHAGGLVHRDIKPENIFVCHNHGDLCFVLGDFDLVTPVGDSCQPHIWELGTPGWSPPERYEKIMTKAWPSYDVFSLASLIWLLWRWQDVGDKYVSMNEAPETPFYYVKTLATEGPIDNKYDGVMGRATRKSPFLRYQTALTFWQAFLRANGTR